MMQAVGHDYASLERTLAARALTHAAHHTPTRFISDDEFHMFPHERGRALPRLAAHFSEHGITTTVTCLPHFLLLDPMVFWTHRAARIPHAAVSANQALAITTMVRELAPQRIIATPLTAQAVEMALRDAQVPADFAWYLFVQPGEPLFVTSYRAYRDLQVIPGLSGGYQCDALCDSTRFHLAPEWAWEIEEGRAIGTRSDNPFPLSRFDAFAVSDAQLCACGRTSYDIS